MTDQAPYIQNQLDTCGRFDGQWGTYELSSTLFVKDDQILERCKFVLTPGLVRGVWARASKNPKIFGIEVYRGDDMTAGVVGNTFAVHLDRCTGDWEFDDITVYGNGPGVGIMAYGLKNRPLGRLLARSMRFSSPSDPGIEQVVGVFIHHCENVTIPYPATYDLDSNIGGVIRAYQTDGFDFSGNTGCTIIGASARNVGEGIDLSGGDGNVDCSIIGGSFTDCDSFGVKLANSASGCIVSAVHAIRCGFAGFVVSGPSEANLPKIWLNTITGCVARDTGSNKRWAGIGNIAGFSIMSNALYSPSLPERIRFVECIAVDTQSVPTMQYGFRNENNNQYNVLGAGCMSIGHTVARTVGIFGG